MLAPFLKRTETLDLYHPLAAFIKSNYGKAKAAELDVKLREIDQLRKECQVSDDRANPEIDIGKHRKYFNTLCLLEKRFPFAKTSSTWFGKMKSVTVVFRWFDSIRPKKFETNFSIKLEKMAVLFNLASLMALNAVKQQVHGEVGLKAAFKSFCQSAGAFQHLGTQVDAVGIACTIDVQKSCANFFGDLMIAQAQTCFYQMAVMKKMSPALTSQLALGSARFYESALLTLDKSTDLTHWMSKGRYNFREHCLFQVKLMKAAAEYYEGCRVAKEGKDGCYGMETARLAVALQYLDVASKSARMVMPALDESRSKLASMIKPRYAEVRRDNVDIYHESVPGSSSLKAVVPKSSAKAVAFSPVDTSMKDPFSSLISKEKQAEVDTLKAEAKAEAKRISDAAQEHTDNGRALLASLGLPAALETVTTTSGLPDSVWQRIAQVQTEGGVAEAKSLYQQIMATNTEAQKDKAEIQGKVDLEQRIYAEISAKMGTKWAVVPSTTLNAKYRDDLKQITMFLEQAVASNLKLGQQLEDDSESFARLAKTREELSAEMPKSGGGSVTTSPACDKLKQLLDQLTDALTAREVLRAKAISVADDGDYTGAVMSEEKSEASESSPMAALKTIEAELEELSVTQESLMIEVNTANEAFLTHKTDSPEAKARQDFIHSLNQAAETFVKLKKNLAEGFKFYVDLMSDYIAPLKTAVTDFFAAREAERDMNLADLGTNVLKLGICLEESGGGAAATMPSASAHSGAAALGGGAPVSGAPAAGGYGAPVAAGGYGAPPVAGGYGAPPVAAGFGPRQVSGGYAPGYGAPAAVPLGAAPGVGYGAPPAAAGGGYGAPPAAGGYGVPPGGGYGYGAPPGAGGYGAPPAAAGGYGYGAPPPGAGYGAPVYGAPATGAPAAGGAPPAGYSGPPPAGYGAPPAGYGAPGANPYYRPGP